MLRALYDYAIRKKLTLPPGYVKKTVKAWIALSSQAPDYVGIWLGDDTEISCPDLDSLGQGPDKCKGMLVEKRLIVLPEKETLKSRFFRDALRSAAALEPKAAVCIKALEDPVLAEKICRLLDEHKIKASDQIGFQVDGDFLVSLDSVTAWWTEYRKQFQKEDGEQTRCLITGELAVPVRITNSIKGLSEVGAENPPRLICFNKETPAFNSFGLKQAANAPVSEEAFGAVKAALDELLKDAPILAGMKFVHWYDRDVKKDEDPIMDFGGFRFASEDEDEDEDPEEAALEQAREETAAIQKADAVVRSAVSGELLPTLNDSYYILLLSGVGGRVMVRRYERGSYQELQKRVKEWNQDLELVNRYGTGMNKPCNLYRRLERLMPYQGKAPGKPNAEQKKKDRERMSKNLSGVTPAILTSILQGAPLPDNVAAPLPDTVAARSLAYIRSKLLAAADGENTGNTDTLPDARACQWLKVWLRRRYPEKKEWLMSQYNEYAESVPYHCGALMAVYAAIQQKAMPDVNTTVTQRYYASAIQTPALVIGQLSRMSVHHLEKLEEGMAVLFTKRLEEISAKITGKIPATLTLEEQSEFALGYYQMGAKMRQEAIERKAAKERKKAESAEAETKEGE